MNTRKVLPKWLYDYIFDYLGAEENPDPKSFCKNLKSDDKKNRIYLGTYFPRSFAESYCIHDNLFAFDPYKRSVDGKRQFSILSVGCGTGGDVLGAVCAIAKNLPSVEEVVIVAYDGNNIAIDYLVDLLSLKPLQSRFKKIVPQCVPLPINSVDDMTLYMEHMGGGFDLITSFKFVNELMDAGILDHDAFQFMANLLAPKLNETGLMTLLDVTDKHLGNWQSKHLNRGICAFSKTQNLYKTLLPIPCHFHEIRCNGARCFTNKRFFGTFSADDKVTYRVMGRADYVDYLYNAVKAGSTYSVNVDDETCPRLGIGVVRDAYDINN